MLKLRVLYRGPLSSCNYGCTYCPFAKRHESLNELDSDRRGLNDFLEWIDQNRDVRFRVLFTPWGEALIRPWYTEAIQQLSHWNHLDCAAIQTNLSCNLDWVANCDLRRIAFWATYHPTEVDRSRFVNKVRFLHDLGVRLSVGVVGLKEHRAEIEHLRREIPPDVYVWINSYKREPDYYDASDAETFTAIDHLFPLNNQRYASAGKPCDAGETAITVDGDGVIRRCHFIRDSIGSIHDPDWRRSLQSRNCTNTECGCYIGYVNLKSLQLETVYGDSLLERIPLLK